MTQDPNSFLGVGPASSPGRTVGSAVHRYRDAYRVAAATVGFGTLIKVLGWIFGAITVISGFMAGGIAGSGPVRRGATSAQTSFIFLAIVLAAIEIVIFYFLGVLVSAVGQILRASLDTAVHTSPLLDDQQRSQAMGL